MNKTILSLEEARELVQANRYKVEEGKNFLSRCIDGRYKNDENLPPQAFPGGDLGELALILATARSYGFEIDREKTLKTLIDLIGGEKNFGFHSDRHGDHDLLASGCGHFKQIKLDPTAYSLETEDLDFIKQKLEHVKKKGAKEIILEGDHMEGAILMVRGHWSVMTGYNLETEVGTRLVQVFVYSQTLTDEKHRKLSKQLLKNKAVKFELGEDEEYLYNALSDMAENHLMETAKRLAPDKLIYQVDFEEDGSFDIIKL
jgi:hypothetical protein